MTNPITVKQLKFVIKPALTPLLLAEAPAIPGSNKMSSDFLFYPPQSLIKLKQSLERPNEKQLALPQYRVNQLYHPIYRLWLIPSKDVLELARRSLL
jgi:hypothetical protein